MKHLLLLGFANTGKTFYGKKISEKCHVPFKDTDEITAQLFFEENNLRLSCEEIYANKGEEYFRNLETQSCLTLKTLPSSVISLGGGTLIKNFDILTTLGKGVYFKCDFEFAYKKLDERCPAVFKNRTKKELEEMFLLRCSFYEAFPDTIIVDIDEHTDSVYTLQKLEEILWATIRSE